MTTLRRPEFWREIEDDDNHKRDQDFLVYDVEIGVCNSETDEEWVYEGSYLALSFEDAVVQIKEHAAATWDEASYSYTILSVRQTGQLVLVPNP